MIARIARLAAAALQLGGAALAQTQPAPLPRDYRQQIADELDKSFTDKTLAAVMRAGTPRPSVGPQPGDWAVCLQAIGATGAPATFAAFFSDGTLDRIRRAVAIDRCNSDSFAALPKPTPKKKSPLRRGAPIAPPGEPAGGAN